MRDTTILVPVTAGGKPVCWVCRRAGFSVRKHRVRGYDIHLCQKGIQGFKFGHRGCLKSRSGGGAE